MYGDQCGEFVRGYWGLNLLLFCRSPYLCRRDILSSLTTRARTRASSALK